MTKSNTSINKSQKSDNWRTQHGPVGISMTNDYLFRAMLQSNNIVLKALICSLLHLDMSEVDSVKIKNPIILGDAITDKEFILDIKVELNHRVIIDLELQVENEGNWTERSLCYLCREFDHLNRGEDYSMTKPTVHIGILDFKLFKEYSEFYATYWMMNEKSHHRYSDKLRLSVLDLNCINLATEEDRKYKIDYWARLFKATTWEEIKMYAESDQYLQEAADTVYKLTQDEKIRQQCEAREDYWRRTAGIKREYQKAQETIKEQESQLEAKDVELEAKDAELEAKDVELEAKEILLERGIRALICSCMELSEGQETIIQKMAEIYGFSQEQAEVYMKKYWKE